jgi:hypothetical protein
LPAITPEKLPLLRLSAQGRNGWDDYLEPRSGTTRQQSSNKRAPRKIGFAAIMTKPDIDRDMSLNRCLQGATVFFELAKCSLPCQ